MDTLLLGTNQPSAIAIVFELNGSLRCGMPPTHRVYGSTVLHDAGLNHAFNFNLSAEVRYCVFLKKMHLLLKVIKSCTAVVRGDQHPRWADSTVHNKKLNASKGLPHFDFSREAKFKKVAEITSRSPGVANCGDVPNARSIRLPTGRSGPSVV